MSKETKDTVTQKEEAQKEEINLDDLQKVKGGAFENVPRVPTNPYDDTIKSKV